MDISGGEFWDGFIVALAGLSETPQADAPVFFRNWSIYQVSGYFGRLEIDRMGIWVISGRIYHLSLLV
jgi:hypothetical protein